MKFNEDFRFNAHKRLLDLDATTNHLMMLVVADELSGFRWDEAVSCQKLASEAWTVLLAEVQTDPMPALDGRPPGESLSITD
ncbi:MULTISPECIES: hypothetical protein [Pseudomonas]|uniref:Uncharacterized protein n=1 Tax=Pseudomonas luteola TaxID=47886 RepID=A0ABS0FTS5_PSELU|nr:MULTISPECIES: hypothetical protein [Pseudomonas]ENA27829.1 hypothetical protein HMPREF1487_09012 [Pseudomonas sp. HPB0071]MBF8643712.1 hypothetical protein [Pseudomonas zeshuii]MBW5414915.1 hypothetical protein [Pseudomonas sp. MAG002Y]